MSQQPPMQRPGGAAWNPPSTYPPGAIHPPAYSPPPAYPPQQWQPPQVAPNYLPQPYTPPAPPQPYQQPSQPPTHVYPQPFYQEPVVYQQQAYYPQMQVIITPQESPNLFLRFLWFIFIGWWLSGLWMMIAWGLILLIVTMPFGLIMVNKLPWLVSLKQASSDYQVALQGSAMRIQQTEKTTGRDDRAHPLFSLHWLVALRTVDVARVVPITDDHLPTVDDYDV